MEGGALHAALEPYPGTGLTLHTGDFVDPTLVPDGFGRQGMRHGVLLDIIEMYDLSRLALEIGQRRGVDLLVLAVARSDSQLGIRAEVLAPAPLSPFEENERLIALSNEVMRPRSGGKRREVARAHGQGERADPHAALAREHVGPLLFDVVKVEVCAREPRRDLASLDTHVGKTRDIAQGPNAPTDAIVGRRPIQGGDALCGDDAARSSGHG